VAKKKKKIKVLLAIFLLRVAFDPKIALGAEKFFRPFRSEQENL